MPVNTDPAHRETERLIREMEQKLAKEYRQAYNELSAKLDDYLRRFETKDRIWRGWVADGTKTQEEYQKWRIGQIAIGERWSEMKTTIAQDLHNVNQIARSTVNGYLPEVYAINHNYATFEVERGSGLNTSYTLYDRQTVERIMRDNPDLMPGYKQNSQVARNIAAGRDVAWNKQKIQSSMIQGIMQGESIDKMAKRLQSVTTADYKAAVRYARTMSTSAQNAGRYAAYQRADDMGIDLTLVWTATLDERTRVSHRFLDSEERDVGEPFSVDGVDIYYPGDLGGVDYEIPGYLIWNCRCTIIAQVKGFEYKVHGKDTDYSQIDGEYEDWKNAHESESEDIDAPARRSDEIRADYINQYQNLGNSRNFDSQSRVDSGIIQTGGRETGGHHYLPDENSTPNQRDAANAYEKYSRNDDSAIIAKNTGMTEDEIRQIRNHIFYEKHDLYAGYGRVEPDYNMAVAWKRLQNNEALPRDLTLLKHELLESKLEKELKIPLSEAHRIASEKYDWWQQVVNEIGEKGEPDGLL